MTQYKYVATSHHSINLNNNSSPFHLKHKESIHVRG